VKKKKSRCFVPYYLCFIYLFENWI